MCGRYVSATSEPDLIAGFGVERSLLSETLVADYNVAPTKPVPVVLAGRAADDRERLERQLRLARWGLVPPWASDPGIGARTFNARIETAAEKPAFRRALRMRRCLVPADGWYEWVRGEGNARDGKAQPHLLRRDDGMPLAFAGLYEWWRDASLSDDDPAAWLLSVSIVTRAAVPELAWVHHRMPVVLGRDAWDDWLDRALQDPDVVSGMALTMPPRFVAVRVSNAVGDVRNEGPQLAEEYQQPYDEVAEGEQGRQVALF